MVVLGGDVDGPGKAAGSTRGAGDRSAPSREQVPMGGPSSCLKEQPAGAWGFWNVMLNGQASGAGDRL